MKHIKLSQITFKFKSGIEYMNKNIDKNIDRNEPNTIINSKKTFDISIDIF